MEAWREELYHHGIKGQKWGVRRFQNEDGSLTEAGKKRSKERAYQYQSAQDDARNLYSEANKLAKDAVNATNKKDQKRLAALGASLYERALKTDKLIENYEKSDDIKEYNRQTDHYRNLPKAFFDDRERAKIEYDIEKESMLVEERAKAGKNYVKKSAVKYYGQTISSSAIGAAAGVGIMAIAPEAWMLGIGAITSGFGVAADTNRYELRK